MSELRTLVLDASYQPISVFPLHTVPWQIGIQRVIVGMCDVVSEYDEYIQTPNWLMKKPAIIVRKHYDGPIEYKGISCSREAIYYRDGCACQYCGTPLTLDTMTFDHVIPQAQGGKTTFDNVVAACEPCNSKKADQTKGWTPVKEPSEPTYWDLLRERRKFPIAVDHESWVDFLQPWEGGIVVK